MGARDGFVLPDRDAVSPDRRRSMTSPNTREAILAAASELYADRGYDAVSMRDVAAAVAIQPASLYHHFKDKDALILAALEHVFSARAAPARDILLEDRPPGKRLDAFIDWLVRLYFDDAAFARLTIRGLLDGNDERKAYLATTVIDSVFAPLSQLISELSAAVDPGLTAASIISLIVGHSQVASTFVHLPRKLRALGEADALSAHIKGFVRRSLGLSNPSEAAP
jgi:AcrR family transcriptional regulator